MLCAGHACRVGPVSRKSLHDMADKPARSTTIRDSGSQSTSGRKLGYRRVNSPRPRRSEAVIAPVFTSMAHEPQLPVTTASTSSGSSRQ